MSQQQPIVLERRYRANLDEVWALWTTKDGFESWWGPEGFRVEVQELDPRIGGALRYDMIAATDEMRAAMRAQGQPERHQTSGRFTALAPQRHLELTHIIDFLPGVAPYESTIGVELTAASGVVTMVVTLSPMHSTQFSEMQLQGFSSQLQKLARRFAQG